MKNNLAIILALVIAFGLLTPVSAQGINAKRDYRIPGMDHTRYFLNGTVMENQEVFPQELASEPSSKDIDGDLSDWNESELVAFNNISLYAGADLWKLYVSADKDYLYIAIATKNTESWDLLYEIALDFITEFGTEYDPWSYIGFSNYTPDYILAFHWDEQTNSADYIDFYNGIQDWWSYPDDIKYSYIASNGLQTMEIAIPWQELDGIHPNLRVMAWIAGEHYDSSAVESIPDDPAVHDSENEWNDHDHLTNFAEVSLSIEGVETWDGDWTQVGGEFYVDHPIIVMGHVELHNVTIIFNATSTSDSLIQVGGGLKIYNSTIMGNRMGRMISLGDYLIIEGSKLLDMDEIKLVGNSVFRNNNLTWEFDVWEPIKIANSYGSIMLDSNHFRSDSKIIDGWGVENISLTNNTFILSGNRFYVLTLQGNNMTIANNDILHSGDWVYSGAMGVSGRNVRIINNSMDFGGIDISWADDPWTWVIENNTLGGEPIFAFIGDSNAGVTGSFVQVILLGVENFTLQNSPIAWREEIIPWKAVLVLRSRNVVVRSNNISAVGSGIYIQESDNVSLINNRIENVSTRVGGWDVGGVILYQTTHILMRNNTMAGGVTINGWSLDAWISHDIDSSNVIGDKPILYVVNMSGETFSGNYGQVILANVTNVVVRDMRVEGDGLNHNYPIQLSYATNVVLENLTIEPWWGLDLDDLENIYRLTITSSNISGIRVNSWDEMWNLTIRNSNITYLYIWGDVIGSLIENNEITEHMDLSVSDSIIRNNNIHSDERWEDVQLRGTGNSFENNTITGYSTALYLEGSDNVIRNNVIKGNNFGIYVGSYANDNIIYGNFFENEINVHVEEDTINFWNTTIGNYWSDYDGADTDEDGIGDTPYVINDDNIDYRPLVEWPYNPFKPSVVLEVEGIQLRLNTIKDMGIWLRDTAAPLGALQFNITFDPTIVEVIDVRLGSGAEGANLASNILNGTVRVAITSLNRISEGELLKISVLGKDIGSTVVDIKVEIASDTNGTHLQGAEVIPGKVTVYTRKKGDIDEDGRITAVDALLYLRFAVGLEVSPYDIDPALDDVTGDGEIAVADALKVLRVAVGLELL